MFTRIVVPLDGSETAELALSRAIQLGREHAAPLHLVRVVDLAGGHSYSSYLSYERAGLGGMLDSEESQASAYLDAIRRRLLEQGMRATAVTPRGRAVQEIVNLVRPGDVVVLTTHGKGRAPRWFLGGVAEEVQRRCRVPVELVQVAQLQLEDLGAASHGTSHGLGAY